MSKHWFGVHRFWGWYPVSWEGWVVLAGMVSSISITVYLIDFYSQSLADTLIAIFPFVALIVAFTMFVAISKGSPPKFGKSHQHEANYSSDSPKAYLYLCLFTLPLIVYYLVSDSYVGATILIMVFGLLYLVYTSLKKHHKTT